MIRDAPALDAIVVNYVAKSKFIHTWAEIGSISNRAADSLMFSNATMCMDR
jgi:hypothetical protein